MVSQLYLLELAPPLGEDDDLVIELLPGAVLKQISTIGGLPAAGQVALLLHAKERRDRRVKVAALLHQHKQNFSFIPVIPIDNRSCFKGLQVYDMSISKIQIHSYVTLWKLTDITSRVTKQVLAFDRTVLAFDKTEKATNCCTTHEQPARHTVIPW